jgi:hypothetical protein
MEISDNSETHAGSNVKLTETMKAYLTETAKWTNFISVVGFVLVGLIVLVSFILTLGIGFLPEVTAMQDVPGMGPGFMVLFVIVFLFYGMIIFFPSWYMFKFSSNTLKSISKMDANGIEAAFRNLKSVFKFYGIFLLVVFSIYALLIFVAVIKNVL